MAKLETVEAFDDLLRDIMDCDLPFGGKVVMIFVKLCQLSNRLQSKFL